MPVLAVLLATLTIGLASPRLAAQCLGANCPAGDLRVGACGIDDERCSVGGMSNPPFCGGAHCSTQNNCRPPIVGFPYVVTLPAGNGTFIARLTFDIIAPYNDYYSESNPSGTVFIRWWDVPTVPALEASARTAFCQYALSDHLQAYLEKTGLTCGGAPYDLGTYSARIGSCVCICLVGGSPICLEENNLHFAVTPEQLGCVPPKDDCGTGDASCRPCVGRNGGISIGGESGGAAPGGAGPNAVPRYKAGGAGHPGLPGSVAWNATLGRYWSHDYAQRIVEDPAGDPSHVWLITEYATFREFTGFDAGTGLYSTNSPTDEKRRLHYLGAGAGWELTGLDGTVASFDASGRWAETVDRNGNAKVADYGSGPLTFVTMPDGRREDFGYYPSGLLHTITEVGVDGTTFRSWTYTWDANGLDLVRIDRPDGTAWRFTYGDARYPGYMTRMELLPAPPSSDPPRVEGAWEYDDHRNAVKTWRGAASFTDPGAVDKVALAFDDPALPTLTTATFDVDATHQDVVTYTVGRDSNSSKPKVLSISGDCPTCGLGPNTST